MFVWPAGLAFAAILPAIVILYFLKLRRIPKVVSSTYLWKRAVDQYRVNRPFQRFQNQLLLWLQLLLLAFLILALSRPCIRTEVDQSGVSLFLIDHSASMNTREEGGSRLDLGKRLIREVIQAKRGSDQMMIVAFSDRAFVAAPMTTEKETLLASLDQIQPTHRPTRLTEAWQTVQAVARQYDRSDIYLVSDGGFGTQVHLGLSNALIHFVPVGRSVNNLGIVHLETRESTDDRTVKEIFAQVFNRRREPATTRVELCLNGRLADAQDVTIAPGERKGIIFRRRSAEGVAEVRIPEADDFPEDNRAWISLGGSDTARVLLVGEENLFLKQVLQNDPDVELLLLPPASYAVSEGELPASDLVVFDGVSPKTLPQGTSLCLGSAPSIEGFKPGPVVDNPRLLRWDQEHLLTRFVNFSTLNVSRLSTGAQPPWMRTLLASDQGPVLSAGERGGSRLVLARFGLLESDWPLRVSFPLFMSNLVRWAKDGDAPAKEEIVRAGQPLSISVPPGCREGALVLPTGEERRLSVGAQRQTVLQDTEHPGLYRVRWDGRKRDAVYVVNLLDPMESDIEVPPAVKVGDSTLAGKDERAIVRRELTGWFLLAALAILVFEWLYYQFRR
jgi:hypothetical protein